MTSLQRLMPLVETMRARAGLFTPNKLYLRMSGIGAGLRIDREMLPGREYW